MYSGTEMKRGCRSSARVLVSIWPCRVKRISFRLYVSSVVNVSNVGYSAETRDVVEIVARTFLGSGYVGRGWEEIGFA